MIDGRADLARGLLALPLPSTPSTPPFVLLQGSSLSFYCVQGLQRNEIVRDFCNEFSVEPSRLLFGPPDPVLLKVCADFGPNRLPQPFVFRYDLDPLEGCAVGIPATVKIGSDSAPSNEHILL